MRWALDEVQNRLRSKVSKVRESYKVYRLVAESLKSTGKKSTKERRKKAYPQHAPTFEKNCVGRK